MDNKARVASSKRNFFWPPTRGKLSSLKHAYAINEDWTGPLMDLHNVFVFKLPLPVH